MLRHELVGELPRLAETSATRPIATNLLMAISVGVFALMVANGVSATNPEMGQRLRWGADFGPLVFDGQYWRLITSSFVHGGFLHLAVNMFSLWVLGRIVEKLFGPWVTFGLYVLSAVGGGLLSISWNPMRVSVGASGAIFGLDGVLIPVLYYGQLGMPPESKRRALGWVVKVALFNLLFGLIGGIDKALCINKYFN